MSGEDRSFSPTRQPVTPSAVERIYGRHVLPQHALTNAFAGFVGQRIKADQHRTDVITLGRLLIDNPGDELRPGGHDVPPAVEHRPQP